MTPRRSGRRAGSDRITPFRDRAIERSLIEASDIGVAVLEKYPGRIRKLRHKGAIDLVTEADAESEAKVIQYLRKRHPGHAIIAEESWDGERVVPAGYAWALDPLDGTTNYAHGLDHFAFSLGVLRDGEPVAGVIVDPKRNHVYRAFLGRGAWRGRKRLHVSSSTRLADCLLATGFPYDRRRRLPFLMGLYGAFLKRTHGVRRFGVAALDLAYVASGQFDGLYEQSLAPWDVAAGMLLVSEAGGKLSDYEGKPSNVFSPSMVAASPLIHGPMRRVIRAIRKEHGER